MEAECPHCRSIFHATRGLFGQDAATLRDVHVLSCEENPRNKCFCGAIFPNSAARDKHATTCQMNPANRFKCPHCPREFLTTFGMVGIFASDGRALRDAHVVSCKDNPANICFCGQVFQNPDARNSHAAHCEMNPANRFDCRHCRATFVSTFTVLGFCGKDGRAARDAHQLGCERNPMNVCYCGRHFANPSARERHAATCEANPMNRFECPHCRRLFVTRYRVMGLVASDGKALRDAHEEGCDKNPANACFCGQLFSSPDARDAHAVKCEMNPANRFTCNYCSAPFVTTYGMFSSCGYVARDAHARVCRKNPANSICEHCGKIFSVKKGISRWLNADVRRRCAAHVPTCERNPQNVFSCTRCSCKFVTRRRWFRRADGRIARDAHHKRCDLIPCEYKVVDDVIEGWALLDPGCNTVEKYAVQGDRGDEPEESDCDCFQDAESMDGESCISSRPEPFLALQDSPVCGLCSTESVDDGDAICAAAATTSSLAIPDSEASVQAFDEWDLPSLPPIDG
mmetsp:Transcript_103224/g.291480  ORF Transcript_103224/g.291480 Transcript_103224/m.291480 type:complete len:514 (+) Transcript_103224:49-1590(+)